MVMSVMLTKERYRVVKNESRVVKLKVKNQRRTVGRVLEWVLEAKRLAGNSASHTR